MPEPLIPDEVRRLYEDLINEGSRVLEPEDEAADPSIGGLLETGLGIAMRGYDPNILLPVGPEAAFARSALRWQQHSDKHPARYAQWLKAATSLQRIFVAARAARDSIYSCVLISGQEYVAAMHHVFTESATHRTRSFSTAPYGQPRVLPDGKPHQFRTSYVSPRPDFIRRGGRAQIVADRDFARNQASHLPQGSIEGEEIRVVEAKLPLKMLVADESVALVALGPYANPCLLIRSPSLVSTFRALFDAYWAQGQPWVHADTATTTEGLRTRRRIIEGLASGLKDEAIARQLGMSARTVRRHVAALMHELGVTTRFAAGVAAFRQGLVTETPQSASP